MRDCLICCIEAMGIWRCFIIIIMISRQQHCTQQRIMYNYLRKGRLMSELHVNILIKLCFKFKLFLYVC